MDYHRIEIRLPRLRWPQSPYLPTPGNVIFTLLVVGGLVLVQFTGVPHLFASPNTAALSTGAVPYQGRIADAAGAPLTGVYSMVFRLYAASAGGAPVWEEQWTGPNSVAVSDGLFNVMLGSLNPIPQALITGSTNLFLGITVGTDDEMTPRMQLGSVPYAIQALTVPDGSVTVAKLSDGAVETSKLADGAITAAKLAADIPMGVPRGTIVMWAGALADIPAGWALCDGTNGTPNLLDRFILGVDAGQNPGETGGANTKTLTVDNLPAHTHAFTTASGGSHSHGTKIENDDKFEDGSNKGGVDNTSSSGLSTTTDGSHTHNGVTNASGAGAAFDVRPKYFRLAFIVKM